MREMIHLKDVAFAYPGAKTKVFEAFSVTLAENAIYGLLGKNGTGKSTLLYLVSGLLRARKGIVRIDGYDVRDRHPDLLKDVFIVPEEFELPRVSLDVYVKMNEAFYPNFNRDVLSRCLQEFELPQSLKLHELSMGQKKKAYMSIALAAGTRLLLMDEPTNGLDIPSKSQFRRAVSCNITPERTLIISTHQAHDVETLLDHVLIVGDSKLLLNASVADITNSYTFGYRSPAEMDDSVIYAEPSPQGNAVVARRKAGENQTPMNLELLFDAVVNGKIK